jgi:hypothetical protein
MLQVANIEEIFRNYFEVANTPARIIELGTMTGRFTNIIYNIRKEIDSNFDLITVDQRRDIKDEYLPSNMVFCQMDLFKNFALIRDMIIPDTLILCDNGNKIMEVNYLGNFLKEDCVIMAHDYFYDRKEFEGQQTWPSCEITWADVEGLGLRHYFQEIMKKGFWLSLTNIK